VASLTLQENFIIKTYLSPSQIRQKLSNEIEAGNFKGSVQENNFEVTRIIHSTNALKPVMKGSISHEIGLTEIDVTMMPDGSIRFLATLWLGFAGFIFFTASAFWIISSGWEPLKDGVHATGVFFGLGYAIITLAFNIETVKSKKFLKELFEST